MLTDKPEHAKLLCSSSSQLGARTNEKQAETISTEDSVEIENALRQLSPIWTTSILITLKNGPLRFSDLKEHLEPISGKILNQRCNKMLEAGLLKRTKIKQVPPRADYELTDRGAKALEYLARFKSVFLKFDQKELFENTRVSASYDLRE